MRKIIWSNLNLNPADWKDGFIEHAEINGINVDPNDEYALYDYMVETNDEYLEDERANLNIVLDNNILAIADLGFWNGRKSGYRIMRKNVNACLHIEQSCDYAEFYCDRYDCKSEQHHHDGTHYITYREIKPGVTETQLNNFLAKIYNDTFTREDVTKYTRSIKPYISKVYGW